MMLLQKAKEKLTALADKHSLLSEQVSVRAKPLSPEQAIGRPKRKDFPIIKGKEVMIQAEFRGHFGQAFTDNPGDFHGSLQDVLNLSLGNNFQRAIFVSTLNAVMRSLGLVEGTQHCKDDAPEKCAEELADKILREYGKIKVGLIGYQPAMFEHLAKALGARNLKVTDLDAERIGTIKHSVEIWDGEKDTAKLIQQSDLVLATGSTIVNSSTDEILKLVKQHDKEYILFGCTIAGIASLLGLKRYCSYGR
ncbi:hypothetical protein H8E77_29645 [bacterium]|nr:hypothetical protein [bacterium]